MCTSSFILDYLQRCGFHQSAHSFLRDAPDTPIKPLTPGQTHPAYLRKTDNGRDDGQDGMNPRSIPIAAVPIETHIGFLFEWVRDCVFM